MFPNKRRIKYFRVKRNIRSNQVQEQKTIIPQPQYRALQMRRRDVVQWKLVKGESPSDFVLHRRGPKGRKKDDVDPLERHAIPKSLVRGTLPERIVFKKLMQRNYLPGADFSFQSSMAGGRLELGGMVVDFVLTWRRIALRVQGPTHDEFLRSAKDEEQAATLNSMGYTVLDLNDEIIYNDILLEDWFRRYLDPGSVMLGLDVETRSGIGG